ncbi:MAG TPA: DUF4431 domain-containing protein [Gemmatimonadales bacterium]|nr:DUF4431 domain-containing protein [Gemmatimonadales bacterium]
MVAPFVALLATGTPPSPTPPRPSGSDSCYHYAPAPIELTGRLIQRTLPGPPNYQSIARGDRPQVVDLLILDAPICTVADYNGSNTDAFQGQDTVQVRRADATWRDVRRLTGQRVTVTGTLAEWALGKDHTPVLIDPTKVQPAPGTGR